MRPEMRYCLYLLTPPPPTPFTLPAPPTPPACSRQHKGPEFSLTGSQQSENNAKAFEACLGKLLLQTTKHNISCATNVLPPTTGSGEKGEAVDWDHQKASRTMSKFIGHDNGLGKFIGHTVADTDALTYDAPIPHALLCSCAVMYGVDPISFGALQQPIVCYIHIPMHHVYLALEDKSKKCELRSLKATTWTAGGKARGGSLNAGDLSVGNIVVFFHTDIHGDVIAAFPAKISWCEFVK